MPRTGTRVSPGATLPLNTRRRTLPEEYFLAAATTQPPPPARKPGAQTAPTDAVTGSLASVSSLVPARVVLRAVRNDGLALRLAAADSKRDRVVVSHGLQGILGQYI